MTLTNLNNSASFIESYGKDEFKPFAYYDKHLDCIRVHIRDCSVVEERLSRIFTMHRAAHADYELYTGFNIKGIRHLFEEIGLPHEGVFKLTEIIDSIITMYPDTFVKMVREEFQSVINDNEIEVSVEMAEAA